MHYLEATFPTPYHNLACDEALLELCDHTCADDLLRVWEPREYCVVLGRASHAKQEVDAAACRARQIPILRRCSGGATVLLGPGCVNYTLVLRINQHAALQHITTTNRYISERHRAALSPLLVDHALSLRGDTDLTIGTQKCAGHAQRRTRTCVLFHGTFLVSVDLSLMETLLPMPARQPAYRQQRSHRDFLTTLPLTAEQLTLALRTVWRASTPVHEIPHQRIQALARTRYQSDAWTFKY